ncbi:HAD hydrolase family protein [Halalkalicoccus sp. NIPERK01]|uniref:HAD family hydrolase n=1 Tax=Halalkalicoccus sp. NIPERK01 TaxID=3053469 RepID=UPI00256F50BA|nr:HAD hydrolase family protein [Halalkalicoccus sp. NIPERK01]MDL5361904.1 HAD hydrolase family protein [Halalkalicoccus sp. NIPERK01]
MKRYDQLYRLYEAFPVDTLRAYQDFVELFPPVASRVALEHWEEASDELDRRKSAIERAFVDGEAFAEIAAHATRQQAFTALDLHSKYDRAVNVLVLDVDETLRSAGETDNEIPRETLSLLTEFHEAGIPIVICTGQTLENVKGFMIQGLGSELVHSGDLSIVYEAGTGVFTPGHGADTKHLLYEDLEEEIVSIFDHLRSRVLREAPEDLRRGCHLQGNEFNVTMKPNFEIGSEKAVGIIDDALVYELDLLGEAVAGTTDREPADVREFSRAFYAESDPEIRAVLDDAGSIPDPGAIPDDVEAFFERIDVAYYEGDAAEIGSLELNKVVGVEAAFSVLGIDDPFALVMGDSKSDLRVMEWVAGERSGIGAAPEHASADVLEFVRGADDLVFDRGRSADMLRTAYALNRLAALD